MTVNIKRAYEAPAAGDGKRVLVDRIWPRGVSKDEAKIDLWLKEVAPSTELRKWFGHDPERWKQFQEKYQAELKDNEALEELKTLAGKSKLTLVFAARDEAHNNAVVLRDLISRRSR